MECCERELAPSNLGINGKLRGCDLVALRSLRRLPWRPSRGAPEAKALDSVKSANLRSGMRASSAGLGMCVAAPGNQAL